jgi:DHA2 family methylenomycin A resistance protein-like MFS transporter
VPRTSPPTTTPTLTLPTPAAASAALAAATLGFFTVTLDALVVSVALPSISKDLGAGMTGLQWVVDGYTLTFAACLLSAGSLTDRNGARRAFALGLGLFAAASGACGLAPDLTVLVLARFAQGTGAALVMPASLALIREVFPDSVRRARAITVWSIGGGAGSAAGPAIGGALNLISWRTSFFINLPVGAIAMLLLVHAARSPQRPAPFDWGGQCLAVIAMASLTYGAIEAGAEGITAPRVVAAIAVAAVAAAALLLLEARARHPMLPLDLLRSRTVVVVCALGFAFLGGYYGLVFVFSLYLEQLRHLSPFATGMAFVPMTVMSAVFNPVALRAARRFGTRVPIILGLALMAAGSLLLCLAGPTTPVWVIATGLIPVALGGPFIMPPSTALLMDAVPARRAGTASGALNTSRQVGAALMVAVFGALLTSRAGFEAGMRVSLLITAALTTVAVVMVAVALRGTDA